MRFYNEITKYNYLSLNTHLLPSAGVNEQLQATPVQNFYCKHLQFCIKF